MVRSRGTRCVVTVALRCVLEMLWSLIYSSICLLVVMVVVVVVDHDGRIHVVLRRSTGVSERGRRLRVARGHAPHGTNYTITVLTSLTHPSGYVISNPRTATNTARG